MKQLILKHLNTTCNGLDAGLPNPNMLVRLYEDGCKNVNRIYFLYCLKKYPINQITLLQLIKTLAK